MNIAVIGTGMVGRLIAVELSKKYQIYAIDNNPKNLKRLTKHNNKNTIVGVYLFIFTILFYIQINRTYTE